MEVCAEMQRLRSWLDAHNIPWHDASEDISRQERGFEHWMCRTHFNLCGEQYSVINGYGSYGGIDYLPGDNAGLLEIMGPHMRDSVTGWQTARQIEKRLLRVMKRHTLKGVPD